MTKSCWNTLQWQPYCTRGHSCVCTPNCPYLLSHLVGRQRKDPPRAIKIVAKIFAMKDLLYSRQWIKFGPNLLVCVLIQYRNISSQGSLTKMYWTLRVRWRHSVFSTKHEACCICFLVLAEFRYRRSAQTAADFEFRENGRPHVPYGRQCTTHLCVYRETVWYFERKERLGQVCAPRHAVPVTHRTSQCSPSLSTCHP